MSGEVPRVDFSPVKWGIRTAIAAVAVFTTFSQVENNFVEDKLFKRPVELAAETIGKEGVLPWYDTDRQSILDRKARKIPLEDNIVFQRYVETELYSGAQAEPTGSISEPDYSQEAKIVYGAGSDMGTSADMFSEGGVHYITYIDQDLNDVGIPLDSFRFNAESPGVASIIDGRIDCPVADGDEEYSGCVAPLQTLFSEPNLDSDSRYQAAAVSLFQKAIIDKCVLDHEIIPAINSVYEAYDIPKTIDGDERERTNEVIETLQRFSARETLSEEVSAQNVYVATSGDYTLPPPLQDRTHRSYAQQSIGFHVQETEDHCVGDSGQTASVDFATDRRSHYEVIEAIAIGGLEQVPPGFDMNTYEFSAVEGAFESIPLEDAGAVGERVETLLRGDD